MQPVDVQYTNNYNVRNYILTIHKQKLMKYFRRVM